MNRFCCIALLISSSILTSGQSIEQVYFGKAEPLVEFILKNDINYLTISHHQFRMAFAEKYTKVGFVEQFQNARHKFHGRKWSVDLMPDANNDGKLVTPIGFDREGGLYFNQVRSQDQRYTASVNYLDKNGQLKGNVVPDFESFSGLQSGTISKNGRFMILSLQGNYTEGLDDLYVAELKNDGWSSIVSLGPQVNSKYQDVTPFLSVDNRTLFFSSNRPGGKGGFDIYMTERLDDSWRSWTKPINVEEINSIDSETSFCFIESDPYAYFVRSNVEAAFGEIMEVSISENIEEDSTYTAIKELATNSYFQIVDISTERSLPGKVLIAEDNTELNSEKGLFKVDSLIGKEIRFKSEGYLSAILKITKNAPKGISYIGLERLSIGANISLQNVLFEQASTQLLAGSYDQLDLLVEAMIENPYMLILLKGFTDNLGVAGRNLRLSQARVEVVKSYLEDQGIKKNRIKGIGYGGQFPIASNETEETRRLNRRVEFEIVQD